MIGAGTVIGDPISSSEDDESSVKISSRGGGGGMYDVHPSFCAIIAMVL